MLLKMVTAQVGLSDETYSTTVNANDGMIQGNESTSFSISFLNRSLSNAYFQITVVVQRFSFTNNQTFIKQFNTSGWYNMNVRVFDPLTMTFHKNSSFVVKGNMIRCIFHDIPFKNFFFISF